MSGITKNADQPATKVYDQNDSVSQAYILASIVRRKVSRVSSFYLRSYRLFLKNYAALVTVATA